MYSARDLCIVLSQRLVLMLINIDFRLLALFLSLSLRLSLPLVDLIFFKTLGCYIDCSMPVSCLVGFVSATSAAATKMSSFLLVSSGVDVHLFIYITKRAIPSVFKVVAS